SDSSSSESVASSSSTHSNRKKKSKRRRLKSSRSIISEAPTTESVCVTEYVEGAPQRRRVIEVANPPSDAPSLTRLPGLSWQKFLRELKAGEIEQVCLITDTDPVPHSVNAVSSDEESSRPKNAEPKSALYDVAREYADVFPEKIPTELPADRGIRHEIDLAPGTKYCVTRQWPLPRDQVKAIDEFFESRQVNLDVLYANIAVGLEKYASTESENSPRKDMVLDSMAGSAIYSAIDLTDGFYQILMREKDTPLTAVITPSGILWEWLVMPQGLKNAPATFNHMVSHVLRPLRDFAPSYFDDIFVHSRAEGNVSALEVHLRHLKQVFQVMRENKLYANLKKCVFCAPEIPVLGCYWLDMANYLHKYTKDYAKLIQPLSSLLKKDTPWVWKPEHREAFDSAKKSLSSAPVLMLADESKPFHRMVRWLSFFSEYNFVVHYKPGKNNILADALSRRPDYDPREGLGRQAVVEDEEDSCATCVASGLNLTSVTPELSLREEIAAAYEYDE
ncbi:polyprotein, partial [Phytophthora megakarya]